MKITNDPVLIDQSVYQAQIEKYVDRVSVVQGVKSIYLMGSIKAPGLSDIDVLVVVEDDFDEADSEKLSVSGMDGRVFLHGPLVIPESLAPSLQYIFYASNLRCIFGSASLQEWRDLDAESQKILSFCYLIDFIESRFLQYSLIDVFEVDKRAWLTRIWSTVHTLDLYEYAFEECVPRKIDCLRAVVEQTRSDWLASQHVDDDFFLKALDASSDINEFIFFSALERIYGNPEINKEIRIVSGAKKIIFSNSMKSQKKYCLKRHSVFNRSFDVFVAKHGPGYLAHLQDYAGIVVDWCAMPCVNVKVKEVKEKRKNLVTRHTAWLDRRAPMSGSLKGYLGIDVSSKVNLRRRIKTFFAMLAS